MNKENIQKWIHELLSGKYPQTKGGLCNKNGYCCLGVACETYIKYGGHLNVDDDNDFDVGYKLYDEEWCHLPRKVCEWLGIQDNGFYYDENNNVNYLTNDNDTGKTFPEIVEIISKYILKEKNL